MTGNDVLKIYQAFHVPTHIRRHMVTVCAVATAIAQAIEKNGRQVDLASLQFAALLHDALKISGLTDLEEGFFQQQITAEDLQVWKALKNKYEAMPDSEAMCQMLIAENEGEIGKIIKKHDFASLVAPAMQPYSLEEKILYYADKRVQHDQVVDLAERLADGRNRYVKITEQLEWNSSIEKEIFQLEKKLFQGLHITPNDIKALSEAIFLQLSRQYLG